MQHYTTREKHGLEKCSQIPDRTYHKFNPEVQHVGFDNLEELSKSIEEEAQIRDGF